jgi:parallel beta-helix repeat protein
MDQAPRCVVSVGAGTAVRVLLTLGVLAVAFDARTVAARTIYVRVAGADANDGASPAHALQHIAYAATVASAGDRIVVGPGTYREGQITPKTFARVSFVADRAGTKVGEPAGDVVVDATGLGNGFELNGNLAVTIDGFVVIGASNGIYVKSESDQVVVSNNVVSGCSENGIYIQDSKSATVFNNLVYANAGSGILVTGNVSGSVGARVMNNTVYQNANRGIFFSGTTIASSDGLVLNNIVQGSGVAGIQVNATSRSGYLSAGNVTADRFASGTPVDVTDVRGDPLFVDPTGSDGVLGGRGYRDDDFHLSQRASGQTDDSPAIDAGSDLARRLKLARASTRTDGRPDRGVVDAGYHYRHYGPLPRRPQLRLRRQPLYVSSTQGSDDNEGARAATAMQTLARALQIAQPGNEIVLLRGTYQEGDLRPHSGKAARDIVVRGMDGAQIVASGFKRGLLLSDVSHITLVGLDISGASESGVEISAGASDITLRSCHLHENGRRGLYVNESSVATVQSTVSDNNGSIGIQIEGGVVDVANSALNANVDQGLWVLGESTVSVSRSDLSDNQKSGVLADQSDVTIADSTIRRNTGAGARFVQGAVGVLTRVVASDNLDGGVQAVSSSVSLSGGSVEANARVGIEALLGVDNVPSDLTVTGTQVCRNKGAGVRAQDSATMLDKATLCANAQEGIRQIGGAVRLTGTTVTQNQTRGLSVSDADSVQLQGGAVGNNGDNGVQILRTNTATISSASVTSNKGNGLSLSGVASASVSLSEVSNNAKSGVLAGDSGLSIDSSTIRGNGDDGVQHTGGTMYVTGVTVTENHKKGVYAADVSQFVLQNAVVGGNADNGVEVDGASAPSIAGCVVHANSGDGVTLLDASAASVWNNLVYANRSTGVLISARTNGSGSPMAQVLNNTIYGNSNRGLVIGGSDSQPASPGATVLRNIVQGNGTAGIQVNRSSMTDYSGDYNLITDPYGAQTPHGWHDVLGDALLIQPAGQDGILGGAGAADDDFHLAQRAAGQSATSPAVDAGGVDVATAALQGMTTRTDRHPDNGPVDLGYHYQQ